MGSICSFCVFLPALGWALILLTLVSDKWRAAKGKEQPPPPKKDR